MGKESGCGECHKACDYRIRLSYPTSHLLQCRMKLDIVIPTFNRAELLLRTLNSLVRADRPQKMCIRINVVDNNSTDKTRVIVEEFQKRAVVEIRYMFEQKQGRSRAVNRGIKAADADLIGLIDDDEEVARDWLTEIESIFSSNWDEVNFISGRCLPKWEKEPPDWLPIKGYNAVIGVVDGGEQEFEFTFESNACVMGGNCVFKRSVFNQVGLYNESLGRTDKGLFSCEDGEMTKRLLIAGIRGIYAPRLTIYHFIPTEKMTKKYFRMWCYDWARSFALLEKIHPPNLPKVLGVPRYMYGDAARGLLKLLRLYLRLDFKEAFKHELPFWILSGYFTSARRLKNYEIEPIVQITSPESHVEDSSRWEKLERNTF